MSNLLKAGYTQPKEEARIIDYNELIKEKLKSIRVTLVSKEEGESSGEFVAGLRAEVVEELVNPKDELEEAERIRSEAEAVLESAKAEAASILEAANEKAKLLEQEARERGMELGYHDGLEAGKKEIEALEEEIREQARKQEREYEEQLRRMEPDLVEVILSVFEKITHVLSQDKRDIVLHLVDNALGRIESSKEFIVRVSNEDYPVLAEHKDMLMERIPKSSEVEIVKDAALNRNQCLIETDGGVFDCSLDVQLENLISDIKVLSLQ